MIKKEKNPSYSLSQIYRRFGIYIILIGIILLAAILNENFLSPRNLINVIRQVAVVMIIACGEQMVITAGMIDLSPGSVVAFTGCLAAGTMVATGNPVIALLVGIGGGALCGYFCGIVITTFSIPPFIITLAMTEMARGLALWYTDGIPIANLGNFTVFGQGYIGPVPVPIIIMAMVLFVTFLLMNKMPIGRYIYAIGGNEVASEASGINVKRMKRIAFLLNGAFVGLASVVYMSRINSGQPAAGEGLEFDAITACVVGGISLNGGEGNIIGTIAGCLIVGIINNILNLQNVPSHFQDIARGAIIAVAVIVDVVSKESLKKRRVA